MQEAECLLVLTELPSDQSALAIFSPSIARRKYMNISVEAGTAYL